MTAHRPRVVVALTGATGAIYGVRLLRRLAGVAETHLIVSEAAVLTLHQELGHKRADVEALADVVYSVRDLGAALASGSLLTHGMVVAPCSMNTLASVAHGLSDNLITRAADVTLKERRRLILLPREAPLSLIHLRNMLAVTEAGGIIFPPLPAFYHHPASLEEAVDHSLERVLDLLGLPGAGAPRWGGLKATPD